MNLKNIIPKRIGNVICEVVDEADDKIRVIFTHTNRVRSSILLPSKVNNEKLFAAGLSIFAAEGSNKFRVDGRAKEVEVVNSNPAIINTFIKFLEMLGFPKSKLRARIELTISQEENTSDKMNKCIKFWSDITGIAINQFNKPIVKRSNTRRRKSEFGSLIVLFFSAPLWRLFNHWSRQLDTILT